MCVFLMGASQRLSRVHITARRTKCLPDGKTGKFLGLGADHTVGGSVQT